MCSLPLTVTILRMHCVTWTSSVLCLVMLMPTWQSQEADLDPESNLTRQLISITRSPESNLSYFLGKLMPWWQTWLSKIDDAGAETAQLREPIWYCVVYGKHWQCISYFISHTGTITPILRSWNLCGDLAPRGRLSRRRFGATLYFTVEYSIHWAVTILVGSVTGIQIPVLLLAPTFLGLRAMSKSDPKNIVLSLTEVWSKK